METFLNRINVILIALVGALVVYQWSGESRADAEITSLRTDVRKHEQQAAVQAEALRRANEDIDDFKTVVTGLKAKSEDADTEIRLEKARVFTLEKESARSAKEAAGLQHSLAAFKDALDSRDSNIRILLDQRQKLVQTASDAAHRANAAVGLYNDLASQYQSLVGKYNDLAKRYEAAAAAANPSKDGTGARDNPNS